MDIPRPDPFDGFPEFTIVDWSTEIHRQGLLWVRNPIDDLTHLVWGRFNPAIATHCLHRTTVYRIAEPGEYRWTSHVVDGVLLRTDDGSGRPAVWTPMVRCTRCPLAWETDTDPALIFPCPGLPVQRDTVAILRGEDINSGDGPR